MDDRCPPLHVSTVHEKRMLVNCYVVLGHALSKTHLVHANIRMSHPLDCSRLDIYVAHEDEQRACERWLDTFLSKENAPDAFETTMTDLLEHDLPNATLLPNFFSGLRARVFVHVDARPRPERLFQRQPLGRSCPLL